MQVGVVDGPLLVSRCRIAATPWLRLVGLLGRPELAPDTGILLPRTGSIHMFFMRFAIDAVFLDGEDRVVKVVPALRPWRVAWARGAASVLEVGAGECAARGVSVGDRLERAPADEDGNG